MRSPSDSQREKNYESRKGRKGIRRIAGAKLEGNEAYIHREWKEGRYYLQFRGSIHEQVGDTNLGSRVTFSPLEKARAWSKANDPRLIIARTSRAFLGCFVTQRESNELNPGMHDCKYNLIYI